MIETRVNPETGMTEAVKPQRITTTMILEDLENGTDRNGIKEKYNLEAWEVTQMFKHPALKGKKAKKVRKLSFEFVDDTTDPNQIDLEDQIKEEEMDTFQEDKRHDAMVDHAIVKSDPANMSDDELVEHEETSDWDEDNV
jgi:hypothetical protein